MIRTRTYALELHTAVDEHTLRVLVEDWPDGSQTIAFKVDWQNTWGPPHQPVREETSGEGTDDSYARYLKTAAEMLAAEDIEDRRRGA